MIEVPLTKGRSAVVDDMDAHLLHFRWYATEKKPGRFYAERRSNRRTVLMHRQVLGVLDPSVRIDHRNGNSLDNRRDNLRVASSSQNGANRKKQTNNTSGFIGVSRDSRSLRWRARIRVAGDQRYLGSFRDAEEAARAYDEEARKAFGPFAVQNFPEGRP